jgi:predicted lipoprotein with Yx(FWY)xxD motif
MTAPVGRNGDLDPQWDDPRPDRPDREEPLKSTKRILTAAAGLPLLLALGACNRGYATAYDTPNNAAATSTPAPNPKASDALAAGAPAALAVPVGIPTDKLIATTIPKMGQVVTDAKGWVLYRFDKDTAGQKPVSACSGKCAEVWPPMLTDGNPTLEGIPSNMVGTITRDDGSSQLTLAGWPLYRYIGDPKPGAWKGQMVNGTWFVIAPDGKKNVTCLPTATPTAVSPPAPATPAAGAGTGTGGGTNYGY